MSKSPSIFLLVNLARVKVSTAVLPPVSKSAKAARSNSSSRLSSQGVSRQSIPFVKRSVLVMMHQAVQ